MEAQNASTDELVSEYTTARHKIELAGIDETEFEVNAIQDAMDIEGELSSRGVSKDKLRSFWSAFAEAHGLDH